MKPKTPRTLAILMIASAAPALAQSVAPICTGFQPGNGVQACTCEAASTPGSVWGSGPYTGDSDICTAARHAGVIGPEGGQVLVMNVTPPESFVGTQSNGVQTSDWGGYGTAFTFYGGSQAAGIRPCGPLRDQEEMTCHCEVDRPLGAVWGSGPYTADSDVCAAAIHSGVIGHSGGKITVVRQPGRDSYEGSTSNGVTSSDWGSYDPSVIVGPAAD